VSSRKDLYRINISKERKGIEKKTGEFKYTLPETDFCVKALKIKTANPKARTKDPKVYDDGRKV
jgi:hypothetical protein